MKNKLYLNKGIYDNKKIYENTIDAFNKALKLNMGLYLTVRETKDHKLIIFEDNNLSRLHNIKDKIEDTTYNDLSYLSFYHIPTLEETLKLINGKVNLIINLKINKNNKTILSILNKYKGNYIILGKPLLLKTLTKKAPNIQIGEILTKKNLNFFDFLIEPDYKSIDISYYDILKIKKIKENNIPLIGYLIDSKKLLKEYKDVFDYIIIDNYSNLIN